jgi:2-haloacid dehalogenase
MDHELDEVAVDVAGIPCVRAATDAIYCCLDFDRNIRTDFAPARQDRQTKQYAVKLEAVAFDVIETLFDIQPLEKRLTAAGLPSGSLNVWFARVLRDAFALEIAGEYKSFAEIGCAALQAFMREQTIDPANSTSEEIIKSFAELPAYSDVRAAFEKLRDADVRIVALTNGSAETTRKMFENARLDEFIARYISIEEVKHWKPAREVYLHAAKTLDVDPTQVALVSAHDWDIQGAKRAGWVIARRRQPEKGVCQATSHP